MAPGPGEQPAAFSHSQLCYFVRVAEEGQISRAARSLHIVQPALSQAIARLEKQLGIELLERHARGVTLTAAGRVFYEKARAAVVAGAEVAATARSLARSRSGMLEIGFLGSPPPITAPHLLRRFADAYEEVEVVFRELRFPTHPTSEWLANVDVAICYSPIAHVGLEIERLWSEPRAVLLHELHPLAARAELRVEDVIDATFYGFHPSVDREWAAFWTLDDHRGGPPRELTPDTPSNALELVSAVTAGSAIITMPAAVANTIAGLVPHLRARVLEDAEPATCSLAWRGSPDNSLTEAFVAVARASLEPDGVIVRRASLSAL